MDECGSRFVPGAPDKDPGMAGTSIVGAEEGEPRKPEWTAALQSRESVNGHCGRPRTRGHFLRRFPGPAWKRQAASASVWWSSCHGNPVSMWPQGPARVGTIEDLRAATAQAQRSGLVHWPLRGGPPSPVDLCPLTLCDPGQATSLAPCPDYKISDCSSLKVLRFGVT